MSIGKSLLTIGAAWCITGNAFALAPNVVDPFDTNNVVIHYAGSVPVEARITAWVDDICDPPSKDEYTATGGGAALVITCALKTVPPVPPAVQGKYFYFTYYLNGGSAYAITPVIDQVNLSYMEVFDNQTCQETLPGSHTWTCDYTSPANQYLQPPVAGGSEFEPELYKGVHATPFPPPTQSAYHTELAYNVVYGLGLHCALLDHTIYTSCAGKGIPSGPIKSLSKVSVASIFAQGGVVYWEQVPEYGMVADTNTNGVPDMTDFVLGLLPGTPIHVCRRIPGSSVQVHAEVYFLRQGCGSPSRSFVTAATSAIPGEVEEITSATQTLTLCADVNDRAIAISPLDRQPNRVDNKYGNHWEYVAIHGGPPMVGAAGVMPTLDNAAIGAYDYMFEYTTRYNTAVASPEQADLISQFFDYVKDASFLVGELGAMGVPDGAVNIPGDYLDIDADAILTEYVPQNPVAWTTRGGLACRVPLLVFP